jgi:16S rRNA (guanine1207-N2)-methyltransferase
MSHYYQNDPNLQSDYKKIRYTFRNHLLNLTTDSGIFSRERVDFGTNVLLNSLDADFSGKHILDIGCGYGIIGIAIAKAYPDCFVQMTDVNSRAVELARENAKANETKNVKIYESSLYASIDAEFDWILSNPPIRAGKDVVWGIAEDSLKHLKKGGILRMVIQKKQGAPSLLKKMAEIFPQSETIAKEKGYYVLQGRKVTD